MVGFECDLIHWVLCIRLEGVSYESCLKDIEQNQADIKSVGFSYFELLNLVKRVGVGVLSVLKQCHK